jgi:hypothetical protein
MRAAGILFLAFGCGKVVFVDPDADLEAKLQFGVVERLIVDGDPRVYFHVRIASREAIDRVELSVSSPAGVFALPTAGAHRQACGRGETCLSVALGPGIPDDADEIALAVPSIGHRAVAPIVVRRLERHAVHAEAKDQNTRASITVVDPIRRLYADAEEVIDIDEDGNETVRETLLLFPRTFDVLVHRGPCRGDVEPNDTGWRATSNSPFDTDIELSEGDDPLACAQIRPALPEHGAPVAFTTVSPRAEVVSFRHTYSPPVESSPLVYLPFFDLELPNAERCMEAENLIQDTLAEAATRIAQREEEGAEILGLPPVQIAEKDGVPCRQTNDRFFSPDAVSAAAVAALAEEFGPDRRVRILIVYAQNLEIGLSPLLDQNFNDLVAGFAYPGSPYQTFIFSIAPDAVLGTLEVSRQVAWLATEEPSFRETITTVLSEIWPFRSSIHTPTTVVPLLPSSEIARFSYYRICSSRPYDVRAVGTPASNSDGRVRVVPPEGPGFQAPSLMPQTLVERSSFIIDNLVVEWQGCERLCDRPAPGGDPRVPWLDTPDC